MLCPLIGLDIIRSGNFRPVSIELGLECCIERGIIVVILNNTVGIVGLILNAVEEIDVIAGRPETFDDPLVAMIIITSTQVRVLSSWACKFGDDSNTKRDSLRPVGCSCMYKNGILG